VLLVKRHVDRVVVGIIDVAEELEVEGKILEVPASEASVSVSN